ncbi:hypothetical protein MP638_006450 [Amoeboaphelidium occidentale]|nr:hypothetical protein MP638_006450 [Amoeboaphelidium occidentale]
MDIENIDYDNIADGTYYQQTFKSRFFEFTYRVNTVQGFSYVVDYRYNGASYKDNSIIFGNNGYASLVMYFVQSTPPQVPPVLESLKTRLRNAMLQNVGKPNRLNVLQWIGPADEQKIHLFCMVWIFHMFDKAINTFGRNIMDFCLQVKNEAERNGPDPSLQGLLLVKLVNLISHSNFEYKITLPTFEFDQW